jgi:hypothetical protein
MTPDQPRGYASLVLLGPLIVPRHVGRILHYNRQHANCFPSCVSDPFALSRFATFTNQRSAADSDPVLKYHKNTRVG